MKLKLKSDNPHIYRTVKLVNERGEGAQIDFGYQVKRFLCKGGCEHFNHLVCAECGRAIYIDSPQLVDFQDALAKVNGFKPTRCSFQIHGICQECVAGAQGAA